MKKIAFIIPVHNRLVYTRECLALLQQHKDSTFYRNNRIYTIVIDDGSTDGTSQMIRDEFPEVIVLQGDGNLWYSGCLNLGIRHALRELDCDFINIWENDIVPAEHYFDNLQSIMERWDGKSLICSKLVYKNHPEIVFSMGGVFNSRTGHKSLIGRNKPDGPEYQKTIEADWFSGQQLLLHKDIISAVGYFDDKNFPQYHADIDYSLRAKKAGFKNVIYPELILLNDSETTGINHARNKSFRQFFDSLTSIRSNTNIYKDFLFYKKHSSSILAYAALVNRYTIYTLSFIKGKVYALFGIKKDKSDLL